MTQQFYSEGTACKTIELLNFAYDSCYVTQEPFTVVVGQQNLAAF